ncbi:MAG: DUF1003 domain-containing protein, partial [Terriglobales bacterium]
YLFYTFSVSVLAILLSSLIMLAGNRQSDVDRKHAENAYNHVDEVNAKQDRQLGMLRQQNKLFAAQHAQILHKLAQVFGFPASHWDSDKLSALVERFNTLAQEADQRAAEFAAIDAEFDARVATHVPPSQLNNDRTLAQRAADWAATYAGSWKFIGAFMLLTAVWCGGNMTVINFDPYPYPFYTFSVSVLAILMSSLILLSGNRQAEIDRAHAENAYRHVDEVNQKQDEQVQILLQQNDLAEEQHESILSSLDAVLTSLAASDGSSTQAAPAAAQLPSPTA